MFQQVNPVLLIPLVLLRQKPKLATLPSFHSNSSSTPVVMYMFAGQSRKDWGGGGIVGEVISECCTIILRPENVNSED